MNKFIRFWNQNRIRIIITALIVVFIIILIQAINAVLKNSRVEEYTPNNTTIVDTGKPTESVISGEEAPEGDTENNLDLIRQFVEYGNNKDYQSAYNLLNDDCKQEIFRSLDEFITDYCNNIFNKNVTYELELWDYVSDAYTYRILYYENNLLQTGNASSNNNIEDYITVVETDSGNRLNINGFIRKDNINKIEEIPEIQIIVNYRERYRDFERYNITVKNTSSNTILLSEGQNGNDICLIDTNDVEYDSIINEVPMIDLELNPGEEKTIEIKFYKMYNLYRTIDKISFKSIVLNKDNINDANKISINIDI